MPEPKSITSRLLKIGFGIAFFASLLGLATLVTHAIQKVFSGHGLDTYHTVWLVEVNYVGLLVFFGAILVAFIVGVILQIREHFLLHNFEKKYGVTKNERAEG